MEEKKRKPVAQEPHSEADCKINEPEHSHPSVDCGHEVNDGPGVGLKTHNGNDADVIHPGAPTSDHDQDPNHGPGIGM